MEPVQEAKSRRRSYRALLGRSLAACGAIYGDIGKTSPIYTLNAIYSSRDDQPPNEDIVGAISAIIWSLILVGIIKTCIISLYFSSPAGEGGPVGLYTTLFPGNQEYVSRKWMKPIIIAITLFASALSIADGVLAPSVSVVSAVGGVVNYGTLSTSDIKGIAVAILFVLFSVQYFGIARLNVYFTPLICIWFLFIFVIGIYNVTAYPAICRAFDPSCAVLWFIRQKSISHLSGVLLAITGVENLYISMGQFDAPSIRLGFICFCFPALVFSYLGQGAVLITVQDISHNVFYRSIPPTTGNALFWVVWVLSLAATVVASQGTIIATFSLVQHLVSLKSFPPIKIVHTSFKNRAQIYIPVVNLLLMIGALCVTGAFGTDLRVYGTDTSLTNAYGFCVSGVLICITFLLAFTMFYVKGWHWALVLAFFILSGFVDGLFFATSLKKVPLGAWFTLCLSVTIAGVLGFWTWAKGLEDKYDAKNRLFLNQVFHRYLDHGREAMPSFETPENEHDITSIPEHAPQYSDMSDEKEEDVQNEKISLPSAEIEKDIDSTAPSKGRKPNLELTLRKIDTTDTDDLPENSMLRMTSHQLGSILSRTTSQVHDGRRVKLLVHENPDRGMSLADGQGKPLKLPRVPMLAFFYHFGSGVGAPHSFTALARRTLVLPRIVVFLSIRIQAVPHIAESDRMVINKLRQLDGFYILTIRVGYRDEIDLRDIHTPTVDRIINLEKGDSSLNHGEFFMTRLRTIREAAKYTTHIIPSYSPFRSKGVPGVQNKYLRAVLEQIRSFLLEDIFTGASQIFSETNNWIIDETTILRVGVSAEI